MTFPSDSFVTAPEEIRRLSDQNQRVLARLQRGPASRHELQQIASNITARISDLREAGYGIPTPVRSVYRLATKDVLRASEPHASSERQDLRASNETAPRDCHNLNEWGLR